MSFLSKKVFYTSYTKIQEVQQGPFIATEKGRGHNLKLHNQRQERSTELFVPPNAPVPRVPAVAEPRVPEPLDTGCTGALWL